MHQITMGVLAVVQDEQQRVLLVKPAYEISSWKFPGGYVEKGESPLEALRRELLEELAVDLLDASFLGLYYKTYASNLNLIFHASIGAQRLKPDGNEVVECAYFSLLTLPDGVSPRAKKIITQQLAGGRARSIPFIMVFESPE